MAHTLTDPPILSAAESGNLESVVKLHAQGVDINIRGKGGYTALHAASQKGQREVVEWLIHQGALVNLQTNKSSGGEGGETALYFAALYGRTEIAMLLLGAGAKPDLRATDGSAALEVAAQQGHIAIVRSLMESGAALDPRGGNPPLAAALCARQLDVAKYLLEHGARGDSIVPGARSPIFPFVAAMKWLPAVDLMLQHGVQIDQVDSQGRTALHNAVLAFATRKSTSTRRPDGSTCMVVEAPEETVPVVVRLLKLGANPAIKDKDGMTPLDWAKKIGARVLIEMIEMRGQPGTG